jgi:putative LysE/RhtB family amino acid efflux pump
MGLLCIQRTLDRGWRAGLATGAGVATADGTYAALAAFGVAAVSSVLVAWQTPLRLVGGAVLIYLGVRAFVRAADSCDLEQAAAVDRRGAAGLYGSAVGLTFTNPMTIMAFGAVFASAGLVAQPGFASAAVATMGIALGSLCWWIALVAAVSLVRTKLEGRLLTGVSKVSGAIIVAFGVAAMVSAVWPGLPLH